jgi:TonB family protein
MIIAYLAFGIVFVSVKIAMNQERVEGAMYIDLTDMQQALETLQQQVPEQQDEGDDFSNVKNRISDENGRSESVGRTTASTAGGGASSSKSIADFMEGLDEEAAAVAGRVKASQDAFAKGRREEQEMIARSKAQREAKEGEKESGVKQKGSVLISYWLPGRRDVSLYMPAYQCEGGGEVTVNITVNRNGKVVSASMKESSTNSSCINDMAILAARNSRFNVDDTGSDKQSGTITYIFVPQ